MSENPLLARSSTERIARKLILRYVTAGLGDLSKKQVQRQVFQLEIETGCWTGFKGRILDRKAENGL